MAQPGSRRLAHAGMPSSAAAGDYTAAQLQAAARDGNPVYYYAYDGTRVGYPAPAAPRPLAPNPTYGTAAPEATPAYYYGAPSAAVSAPTMPASVMSATMAPAGPPTGYGRSGMGAPPPAGAGRAPAMSPYEEGMAAIHRDVSNLGGMAAALPGRIAGAAKDWYTNGGPLGGYTRAAIDAFSGPGAKPAQAAESPKALEASDPADDAPVMPASEIASRLGAPADQVASLSSPVPEARDGTAQAKQGAQFTRPPPVPVAKPGRGPAKPAPASGELQPGAPLPPITTPPEQVGVTGPWRLFSADLPPPRPVAQPAPPTFGESRNLLSWLAGSRDPAPA